MKTQIKNILKYITVLLIILTIIIFVSRSDVLKQIIYMLLISLLIAYVVKPIHRKLAEMGMKKSTAALTVIGAIVFIITAVFLAAIPYFFKDNINIKNTLNGMQYFIDGIYSKLNNLRSNGAFHTFTGNVYHKLNLMMTGISNKICDSAINFSGNFIYILIVPIVVYYFLSEGDSIEHNILGILPIKTRNIAMKIGCHIDKILERYIVSQLMLSIFIGVATFIILVSFSVKFPIVLALVNAIFNIIPYFGPIFGAVPAIFAAFMKSPRTAVEVIICLYILQQLEGNILCPKLTGSSISMHPLTVIILLLAGGEISGFIGMVVAVPIGAVIKIIYRDLNYYIL